MQKGAGMDASGCGLFFGVWWHGSNIIVTLLHLCPCFPCCPCLIVTFVFRSMRHDTTRRPDDHHARCPCG